jgi:hypothetical protein
MDKSLLNLYLEKYAAGNEAYEDRLCTQLAERLVYVPVVEESSITGTKGGVKVKILRVVGKGVQLVPVFTSEARFNDWAARSGHKTGSISLLGADLCTSISKDSWLGVDAGSKSAVKLHPRLVAKIAAVPPPPVDTAENPVPEVSAATEVLAPAAVAQLTSRVPPQVDATADMPLATPVPSPASGAQRAKPTRFGLHRPTRSIKRIFNSFTQTLVEPPPKPHTPPAVQGADLLGAPPPAQGQKQKKSLFGFLKSGK